MGKCQDLLEAARNGNVTVVRKLLQHKGGPLSSFRRTPSINWQDVNGYTPLHHACLNGHLEIVNVLLHHGAAHDIPDIRGSTPLYLASWAGHEHIVALLLIIRGKENLNAQTMENETALHCAAQHGHNMVVTTLLANGADPTIRNNSFQTALDLAAQFGRLKVVQILINTHPELIEPYRLYDEVVALENGCSPPYKITPTKHIFTQSCLHLAARNGHNEVVTTLLEAGVDVNVLTHAGSALHEAALGGKKSVVYTLLRAGVDLYAVDGNGRTALDILKEYPTHVTFEIVTLINDFQQSSCNKTNNTHSRPIEEVIGENTISSNSTIHLMESDVHPSYKQQHSLSMNSLERYNNSTERYTPMEPIKKDKSSSNLTSECEQNPEYKSVYKSHLPNKHLEENEKQFPKFFTISKMQNTPLKSTLYKCIDEYVEMTIPNSSACSAPRSPSSPISTLQSLSCPRKSTECSEYANTNIINTQNTHHACHNNDTISSNLGTLDRNNNTRENSENENNKHSPTPDCPPPSAFEAESTIFELVKPSDKTLKRKSILSQHQEIQFYDGLKSFIWEDQTETQDKQFDSQNSSRVSECVEEFVSDVPFAGLFKGSSLNLANLSSLDLRNSAAIEEIPSGLRSPSLVRSVKPTTTECNVTIKSPTSDDEFEFDAAKAWDEINTIFESIGNEVSAKDAKLETINGNKSLTNTLRKKSLIIRKPAELLLGSNTYEQNTNPNWCHSANTLIYGYVVYDVFYLGSTVIRELHGTASTRKSIQKLKREETPTLQETNEENVLINDINSSTRILKATNQQTRLGVGIALSHAGVRFVDNESKGTICVHDIENINCVSQDTDDLRYFAYITRENDIHYCHVFMVDNLNLATEIILTLGQAFEVAYQLSVIGQEDSQPITQFSTPVDSNNQQRSSYIDIVDSV